MAESVTPQPAKRKFLMPDQRSVTEQLHDLWSIANKSGMYDAAVWLENRVPSLLTAAREQRDEILERLRQGGS